MEQPRFRAARIRDDSTASTEKGDFMGFRISAAALAACIAASSASADVTISSHATKNMSCSAGLCAPTAATAFLNAGDLQTMLASSGVTVKSNAAAPDIHVALALSWASSNTLTLDSYHAITIERPISVTGTGGLTILTDDGGTGGDYSFTATGHAIFWDTGSSLTINAQSYTLVASIAAMASGYAAVPSGNFALANDYDAAPDGTYAQAPIAGTVSGNFEGLGNTISNLSIRYHGNTRQNIGLFATVNGGTIRDLNLRHAKVMARPRPEGGAQAGTLVGQISGTVLNDTAVGAVSVFPSPTVGAGDAGGLVGVHQGGAIVNSSFDGTVSAGRAVAGGLAGQVVDTQVTRSSSTATVNGTAEQGGLVGIATNSTFLLDRATGGVGGAATCCSGGLIGLIIGTQVSQSYATGSVLTDVSSFAGGLVGWSEQDSAVLESYALGAVTGRKNSHVGGLVGDNRFNHAPSIAQAYSTGAVSATGGGTRLLVGGSIGFDKTMSVQSSYWDLDASGISDPSQGAGSPANDPGITGLSDAALKSGLPSGFDPGVWGSNPAINGGLPYLLALPPS